MKQEDLTIFHYRMQKEISNHEYVLNERIHGKYQKISVSNHICGFVDCYIYRPENYCFDKALNIVFNFHGGGMVLGYCEQDGVYCQYIADRAHVAVINIDYCLAPEYKYPKPIYATYDTLVRIVENAEQYYLDPSSIYVMGHSAGGYLATTMCIINSTENILSIKGVIQDYAIYKWEKDPAVRGCIDPSKAISTDRMRQYLNWYFDDLNMIHEPLASTLYANLEHFPPILIICAEYDSLKNEAMQFRDKAIQQNVPVFFRCFEGCEHGFTHKYFKEYDPKKAEEAWELMVQFILGEIIL